jgi:hypothetical protein
MKRLAWAFLGFAVAAFALGGCSTVQHAVSDPSKSGPFFKPKNFLGEPSMPSAVRRVVLMPVHGGAFAAADTSESLDPVFATALEKQMRFEVVTMSREECEKSFGTADLSSAASLPHDFLKVVGDKYGAQAVVFVDITAYKAYRPLSIGVRAKLADVTSRRLIWSFDELFSMTDPAIVNSVRHYYKADEYGSAPFDLSTDSLDSPGSFAAYVADAVFKTLPAR